MRTISYVDLEAQYAAERAELEPRVAQALARGQWVGGPEVAELEAALARRAGSDHAIAVGSGTDALILALRALGIGPGDEVITPPNSFVSSTAAIAAVGARPVFVDVLPDQSIDPRRVAAAITRRTRALMPVHLTGRMAPMSALLQLAWANDLLVVEDAAQAFGSRLGGHHAGTLGHAGCFSAHPLKNLNACGDAGFVLTDDPRLAQRLGRLRNNGLRDRDTVSYWGTVSRLDTVQAVILRFRLERLDAAIAARRNNAAHYRARLDPGLASWPAPGDASEDRYDTFHTFVVQVDRRDELQGWLGEHGIATSVHYPTPLHLQPAASSLGHRRGDFPAAERQAERILSLPIHPFLDVDDIDYVVDTIHQFYRR